MTANPRISIGCTMCGWRGRRVFCDCCCHGLVRWFCKCPFGGCPKCGTKLHTTEQIAQWRGDEQLAQEIEGA